MNNNIALDLINAGPAEPTPKQPMVAPTLKRNGVPVGDRDRKAASQRALQRKRDAANAKSQWLHAEQVFSGRMDIALSGVNLPR